MVLRIGCVGYSYDFWVGTFYPRHTHQDQFLRLYSKVFDLVEVDFTFYSIPSPATTGQWRGTVPAGFEFAAKFPRKVTHEMSAAVRSEATERFLAAMEALRPKAGPLLVQLPPSVAWPAGRAWLLELLDGLPDTYRYAVEFRDQSWFRPAVFDDLRRRDVALVWNEVQYVDAAPEITTDFLYLRFIGDRSLEKLGKVQIDRTAEMEKWAARLHAVEDRVERAYVLFNNHFAGFGPPCADAFRKMYGLPGVDFAAIHAPERGQAQLTDFGPP